MTPTVEIVQAEMDRLLVLVEDGLSAIEADIAPPVSRRTAKRLKGAVGRFSHFMLWRSEWSGR